MTTDILVIGSGISGLTYAIKIAEHHPEIELVLIAKDELLETNTRYAQGGIAVVSDFKQDSFKKHIKDTLIAGDGMCEASVVQFVIEEGHQRLKELQEWGTQFDTLKEELHLTKEGGHSEKRIVHYKDQTGLQIQEALIKKIKSFPNVRCLENHVLVDLITDHHTKTKNKKCYGAYVISKEKEEIITIGSKATILTTGGAGQLYSHTTNPAGATGDGLGAAYRAKVKIQGLSYVQFHPTALVPKIDGATFLITEAVRGEGGVLKNKHGKAFMATYDLRADLAPRDIVARAIAQEMQNTHATSIALDCSKIGKKQFKEHFPTIYQNCHQLGIQVPEQSIPVAPAAHYFCGGIAVNEYSRSELDGLYAIGECSYTGLHGANRLASNSLLESLVFAHRAALDSKTYICEEALSDEFYQNLPVWKGNLEIAVEKMEQISDLKLRLRQVMTEYAGIFKSIEGLEQAETKLGVIYQESQSLYQKLKLTPQFCELRNMVSVAYILIKQSQQIKSNQGTFYNADYA
ncbi:MAG: L-aspartate oxidase [Flavobacteriaceae bacterium]|nr:MAG: L-aspartate oxidase [Flavobacteriaceae bacterium]